MAREDVLSTLIVVPKKTNICSTSLTVALSSKLPNTVCPVLHSLMSNHHSSPTDCYVYFTEEGH